MKANLNIADLEDVALQAKAEAADMFKGLIEDWYQPYIEAVLVMQMDMIPEEVKIQLRNLAPEAMKKAEETVELIKQGAKYGN